jgi:uncharacterized protein YndB with AHSA1/START domain
MTNPTDTQADSFDLAAHLRGMTRRVESTEHEGKPAKVVRASCVFDTSAENLWDALTNPEKLSRWFLPVSGDLRLHGRYQFEGNASGSISTCVSPTALAVTWEYGGEVSWLTLRLSPETGGATRLTLEHLAPVTEHWAQFGPGAAGIGWDMSFMGLARYLLSLDPDEEWPVSREAREFYRATSIAWGQAAMADGTPEGVATAAAERARAFYSGEEASNDSEGS